MPVPSSISDLSQTAASNNPPGSESPNTTDDYLRTYAAFIASLRDGVGFTDPVTIASATTTDIGGQSSMFVEITGSATITGFGTTYNGPRFLRFTGSLTLTHNATTLNLPGAANVVTAAGDTCIAVPNSTPNGWNIVNFQSASTAPVSLMNHGRCRLSYQSSTALILTPYNGNTIVINGQVVTIPSAGVTLSNSGASNSTLYYIYAYLSSGVLTLEYSATGHSTDTTTGVEIKTGDTTRTLVGMARTTSGGVWNSAAAQRFVLSYFNRREIVGNASLSTIAIVSSTSYVEVSTSLRNEWLTWADEPVKFMVNGGVSGSGAIDIYASIGVDGITAQDVCSVKNGTNATGLGIIHANTFSEGYHYSTAIGRVSGGSGSWAGSSTTGERTTHQAIVMG